MDFKSLRNLTLIRKTLKIDILRLKITIKMVVQKLSMHLSRKYANACSN